MRDQNTAPSSGHSPRDAILAYHPAPTVISAPEWKAIRPFLVETLGQLEYPSASSAQMRIRYAARLVAWARHEGIPMKPEKVFAAEHAHRFIATELKHLSPAGKATVRSHLRAITRAVVPNPHWSEDIRPFANARTLAAPYSDDDVAGFWRATQSQATDHRAHVLTALLTLGLGAGLKPREALSVTRNDMREHVDTSGFLAIELPDRIVPVLTHYAPRLEALCQR